MSGVRVCCGSDCGSGDNTSELSDAAGDWTVCNLVLPSISLSLSPRWWFIILSIAYCSVYKESRKEEKGPGTRDQGSGKKGKLSLWSSSA